MSSHTRISPQSIKEELDKFVAGQDDVKRKLSIVGYNHYLRHYRGAMVTHVPDPINLIPLVMGPTGTGKTLMINTLASYLGYPIVRIDATSLGQGGSWAGRCINDQLKDALNAYKNFPEWDYIAHAIVFIDEFDKICGHNTSSSGSNIDSEVQSSLLIPFEGSTIRLSAYDTIDTHKMLFILGGSFSAVSESLKTNKSVGFKAELKDKQAFHTPGLKDLEDFGAVPEILGRISPVASTNKLTKAEIRQALDKVADSILDRFKAVFWLSGRNLTTDDLDMDMIVDRIYESDYGMRFAKTVLFEHLEDRIFELSLQATSEPEPSQETMAQLLLEEEAAGKDPLDLYDYK